MKIRLATETQSTAFYIVAGSLGDYEYKKRREEGIDWYSWSSIQCIGNEIAKKHPNLRWAPSGEEGTDLPKLYVFRIYYKKGDTHEVHKFVRELDEKILGAFSSSVIIFC